MQSFDFIRGNFDPIFIATFSFLMSKDESQTHETVENQKSSEISELSLTDDCFADLTNQSAHSILVIMYLCNK